jgi:hypothetical protein
MERIFPCQYEGIANQSISAMQLLIVHRKEFDAKRKATEVYAKKGHYPKKQNLNNQRPG